MILIQISAASSRSSALKIVITFVVAEVLHAFKHKVYNPGGTEVEFEKTSNANNGNRNIRSKVPCFKNKKTHAHLPTRNT